MIIKRMIIKRMTKEYISIITMNMVEEESVEFRLREIDETRNYLLDKIKHNNLMREKYKKTFKYLNQAEHFLILVSTVTGCVSISTFASLAFAPVGITSSVRETKVCAITAEIKKYKSVIKKKKKHDKMALLGKDKIKTTEVLINVSFD